MSGVPAIQRMEQMVSFDTCEAILSRAGLQRNELEKHTVHLWGWKLEASSSCLDESRRCLDKSEREQSVRFVRDEDRKRYILAHACLRAVLGRYLDCPPQDVQLRRTSSGKPFIASEKTPEHWLRFNLSHSHDRMLVGIAKDYEIGVDLERVKPDSDILGLAARYYAEHERSALAKLSPDQQRKEFFRYWVAKEAVLKGQGVGIPSLQDCEVHQSASGRRAAVVMTKEQDVKPEWMIEWILCGADWEAAVAFPGEQWTVRYMPDA